MRNQNFLELSFLITFIFKKKFNIFIKFLLPVKKINVLLNLNYQLQYKLHFLIVSHHITKGHRGKDKLKNNSQHFKSWQKNF